MIAEGYDWITVKVSGIPMTKGSMTCIGQRGKVKHNLVEENKSPAQRKRREDWRAAVKDAGALIQRTIGHTLTGAVSVEVTLTLPFPKSVKPADRPWPIGQDTGDSDKLVRMVLDALEDAGVYDNDCRVVEETGRKVYPHSPHPDALPKPGALIRIWRTEDDH